MKRWRVSTPGQLLSGGIPRPAGGRSRLHPAGGRLRVLPSPWLRSPCVFSLDVRGLVRVPFTVQLVEGTGHGVNAFIVVLRAEAARWARGRVLADAAPGSLPMCGGQSRLQGRHYPDRRQCRGQTADGCAGHRGFRPTLISGKALPASEQIGSMSDQRISAPAGRLFEGSTAVSDVADARLALQQFARCRHAPWARALPFPSGPPIRRAGTRQTAQALLEKAAVRRWRCREWAKAASPARSVRPLPCWPAFVLGWTWR